MIRRKTFESVCHLFILNRLTANKCHPVARYDIASAVGKTKDVSLNQLSYRRTGFWSEPYLGVTFWIVSSVVLVAEVVGAKVDSVISSKPS